MAPLNPLEFEHLRDMPNLPNPSAVCAEPPSSSLQFRIYQPGCLTNYRVLPGDHLARREDHGRFSRKERFDFLCEFGGNHVTLNR